MSTSLLITQQAEQARGEKSSSRERQASSAQAQWKSRLWFFVPEPARACLLVLLPSWGRADGGGHIKHVRATGETRREYSLTGADPPAGGGSWMDTAAARQCECETAEGAGRGQEGGGR